MKIVNTETKVEIDVNLSNSAVKIENGRLTNIGETNITGNINGYGFHGEFDLPPNGKLKI